MGEIWQGKDRISSKTWLLLLLLFLLLLSCCGQTSEVTRAKVIRVIDSDTIIIEGEHHIRYIGIDTPEEEQPDLMLTGIRP